VVRKERALRISGKSRSVYLDFRPVVGNRSGSRATMSVLVRIS